LRNHTGTHLDFLRERVRRQIQQALQVGLDLDGPTASTTTERQRTTAAAKATTYAGTSEQRGNTSTPQEQELLKILGC
jgi:hypothetical protein